MEEIPVTTVELAALRAQLRLSEQLLAAKDRELAAKEETLSLLRDKVSRLERAPAPRRPPAPASEPLDGFHFVSGLDDPWAGPGGRGVRAARKPTVREEPPKGLWARFYHWFREA